VRENRERRKRKRKREKEKKRKKKKKRKKRKQTICNLIFLPSSSTVRIFFKKYLKKKN
jgi:hypothetical protein